MSVITSLPGATALEIGPLCDAMALEIGPLCDATAQEICPLFFDVTALGLETARLFFDAKEENHHRRKE